MWKRRKKERKEGEEERGERASKQANERGGEKGETKITHDRRKRGEHGSKEGEVEEQMVGQCSTLGNLFHPALHQETHVPLCVVATCRWPMGARRASRRRDVIQINKRMGHRIIKVTGLPPDFEDTIRTVCKSS
ncbi:hypothetical protein Pcinc_031940 [Petrolisthes cinctipes]|uniref:Uncharacterized protein n=1 Tax=Petrolisthes cinctipes TaxID=88211 RepID=A0AAE1EV41_PETCI|nr:hypothetical protein Pcinc_031940 [Petrolisthes cinctipes]